MGAAVRLLCLLWIFSTYALIAAHPSLIISQPVLLPRTKATITNSSGSLQVFDPDTGTLVPQAPATDGSGSNFNAPALIWIGFCLLVGVPLALAGVRGWRFTTGASVGLTGAVCAFAAINNAVDAPGLSDILITALVIGFFGLGFAIGVFEFARLGAIVLLSVLGGLAFGIRIILIKQGLLLAADSLFVANWAIIATLGAITGLLVIWFQRVAILLGCSSVGTFLSALGVDLIMSKQAGLSQGLRFLFDRNDSHLADIITNGYTPSMLTRIIIYASLGSTPLLAFAQHKIFKQPFTRRPEVSDAELGIDFPPEETRKSRFLTTVFEGGNKLKAPSRFSM